MVVIVVAVVMVTLTKPPCHLLIDLRLVRSLCVTTLTKLDQFHGNLDHRANLQYSTLSGTPFANPHKQERAVKQEVPIAQILQSEITSPGIIQHLASDPPATPPVTSQWMPPNHRLSNNHPHLITLITFSSMVLGMLMRSRVSVLYGATHTNL